METDRIERETLIAAPVERVWEVLTSAEHVGAWFCDDGAEVDLRPGGAIVLRWAQMGSAVCRLERVEPPHALAWRWPTNDGRSVEPEPGHSTLVEFTLDAVEGGTRLRVVESGFDALVERTDEQRAALHDGNVRGWETQLRNVAEYAQRTPA